MISHMTVRTTISMPDEIWNWIESRQKETGASTSEIVRRALLLAIDASNGTKARSSAKRPAKPAATPRKRPARPTRPASQAKRASKRPAKVA